MTDVDFMSVLEKGDGIIVVDHAALSKPGAMLRVEGIGVGMSDPTEQEIAAVSNGTPLMGYALKQDLHRAKGSN